MGFFSSGWVEFNLNLNAAKMHDDDDDDDDAKMHKLG